MRKNKAKRLTLNRETLASIDGVALGFAGGDSDYCNTYVATNCNLIGSGCPGSGASAGACGAGSVTNGYTCNGSCWPDCNQATYA